MKFCLIPLDFLPTLHAEALLPSSGFIFFRFFFFVFFRSALLRGLAHDELLGERSEHPHRSVCIVGITTSPDKFWMAQMARNISLAEAGFLNGCRYLLHDRYANFFDAFNGILEAVGIKSVRLPRRSPNLNANLERWHRSVKEECLSKLILFGEASLRRILSDYVPHFHGERNHQGKGTAILFPRAEDRIGESTGEIQTRERLGGLLKFYYRQAA